MILKSTGSSGKLGILDLQPVERVKLAYGERRFKALDEGVALREGTDWSGLRRKIMQSYHGDTTPSTGYNCYDEA